MEQHDPAKSPHLNAERAIALGEHLETLKGKRVQIQELISWRAGTGFERHSTVRARFQMLVLSIFWQMSGGHFTLEGADGSCFQIGTTMLNELVIEGERLRAVERFSGCAERQSSIQVLTGSAKALKAET